MIDRRLLTHINWPFFGLTILLLAVGVLNLYSASAVRIEGGLSLDSYYQRQMVWGGVGMACMVLVMAFDYRHLRDAAWPIYWTAIAMLVAVYFFGRSISGARRWLDFGLLNVQPSELAKIAILLIGAKLIARQEGHYDWPALGRILGVVVLPALLIFKQPDLGSGLTLFMILGGMLLVKGVSGRILKFLILVVPAVLPFTWFFLHDYQKARIMTFLNPGRDPLGAGYHIIQSQIAIGSGEMWGKGFMEGTQGMLSFLPEKHTDFAFAVLGEEWGFMGAMILLSIFCAFLYQIYLVAVDAKDEFGRYLAVGVFFYFFLQIFINIGMVLGLMPVVGIPLPFISYGGSAAVVNFCLIGLVLNVSMRRFMFKKG
ncbi:MAG: rod shape-determining protein RodA [Deltaproteobacteria bacterium]|nr:rod shape-determining protein RodA [Deltaproteobacteria bacterium]